MRNKVLISGAVALGLAILAGAYLYADVIKLKNGRRLEGAIISQTDKEIVVDIGAGEAYINMADVSSIEKAKEDNAAIYYKRALKFATYIEPGELKKRVDLIEKNRWAAGEKELDDILKENARCLEEVKKGLAVMNCNFEFEKKYRYLQEKEQGANPKEVHALGHILILKAKSCEAAQKFDEAVDWYLSVLTFSGQISRSDDPELKHVAVNLDSEVFSLIGDYLNSPNVDKANCRKILDKLALHEKERFSLVDYVRSGREWYLAWFQSTEDDITRWYRENYMLDIKIRKKALNYAKELVKQAKENADKYYGAFLKAAKSGLGLDWKAANDEYARLMSGNPESLEDDIDREKFIYDNFENILEFEKRDAKKVSTTWLAYEISYLKNGIDTYKRTAKELKGLKILAKLKIATMFK